LIGGAEIGPGGSGAGKKRGQREGLTGGQSWGLGANAKGRAGGGGRGAGEVLKRVGRRVPAGAAAKVVEEINDGLGGSAEEGGALRPAHGQAEGEGDEGGFTRGGGEGDTKGRDAGGVDPDAVETVGKVELEHVDGAMAGGGHGGPVRGDALGRDQIGGHPQGRV
jgi:hypothetical protein